MHRGFLVALLLAAAVPVLAGRRFPDERGPASPHSNRPEAAPPTGTVTLSIDGHDQVVWPFTGSDFGTLLEDPINLVFVGQADPLNIRAALLGLDGDRSGIGLPNVFPFNCTWRDTTGYNQAGYAAGRWAAAPVQLECGEYTVMRTHLRLFQFKGFTLANAHFELMVPNTAQHMALAWDFPQALVTYDLVRSGVLAADPEHTPPFTPTPTYRTIDYRVFNGVPAPVRSIIGLPTGTASADVPIPNDGVATVLRVAGTRRAEPLEEERSYHREYNVPYPKPFCATGPLDYVLIQGPIDIVFRVALAEDGTYTSTQEATGTLTVTPIDPRTMTPTGPPADAPIRERQNAVLSKGTAWGESVVRHTLRTDPEQALFEKLRVGNHERYERDEDCGGHGQGH